jgi:4-oxalomesaconate tautomerase
VATAAVLPGTVCDGLSTLRDSESRQRVSVEHPTGEFTVELVMSDDAGKREVLSAALLRTARWLMDGVAGIPATLFSR